MRPILCLFLLCAPCYSAQIGTVSIPDEEMRAIQAAVRRNVPEVALRPDMVRLLVAIRRAENGGPGRQFGILVAEANTLDLQAGWCAGTCYKNWKRWQKTDQSLPYLVFLQRRYCPVGADNDPGGLNVNWLRNVTSTLERLEDSNG